MRLGDITGHGPIRHLIARAVSRDSLPPSLMLVGPEGVGKRSVALALAAFVNCEVGVRGDEAVPASDGCGECGSCRRVARGSHVDVITIAPGDTGSIKVDSIRSVVNQVAYRPFEGRRRVVVIDDAERLVPEAQNALLKTLEEPPSASMFLLITHRPHLLLPTVRSRCPQIRFGNLSTEGVAGILASQPEFEPDTARAAAAVADGSVSRALEAGSSDQLEVRRSAVTVLRALAGKPSAKSRLGLGKEFVSSRPGGRSTKISEREALICQLRALNTLFRDLQIVSARGDYAWLANADLESELVGLSRSYDIERAGRGFENVDRAVTALTRNASPKVVVDWLTQQI